MEQNSHMPCWRLSWPQVLWQLHVLELWIQKIRKLGRQGYTLNADNSSSNKEVTCTNFMKKTANIFEVDVLWKEKEDINQPSWHWHRHYGTGHVSAPNELSWAISSVAVLGLTMSFWNLTHVDQSEENDRKWTKLITPKDSTFERFSNCLLNRSGNHSSLSETFVPYVRSHSRYIWHPHACKACAWRSFILRLESQRGWFFESRFGLHPSVWLPDSGGQRKWPRCWKQRFHGSSITSHGMSNLRSREANSTQFLMSLPWRPISE